MQTTLRSMDNNEVNPKRPEKGGRRYGYSKQRNEAMDSPTPRIEAYMWRKGSLKGGPKLNWQKETLTAMKAEEIRTNAEGKGRNPN